MDNKFSQSNPAATSRHPARLAAIGALALCCAATGLAQEIRRPRVVEESPDDGVSEIRTAREVLPNDADNEVVGNQGNENVLRADPKNDLLKFANMHFSSGDFELALQKYSEYLALNPDGPEARIALYNSAESLRKLDRQDLAAQRYMQLVQQFKTGDYVAESAYKSGAISYNERDYAAALPRFKAAEVEMVKRKDLAALLLDTRYRIARCLQNLGRGGEAMAFLKVIAEAPDPNPFRERVNLALARQSLEANDSAKALEYFTSLIKTSNDPAIKAEAATRAALIESDLNHAEKADELFDSVLGMDGAEEWKSIAQFGLIRARYAAKDWQGVVKAYQKGVFKLSDDVRAQMFLMVGNAFQKLGDGDQAIKVYGILENFFKDREEGKEAAYRKLLVYYESDRPELTDPAAPSRKRTPNTGTPTGTGDSTAPVAGPATISPSPRHTMSTQPSGRITPPRETLAHTHATDSARSGGGASSRYMRRLWQPDRGT